MVLFFNCIPYVSITTETLTRSQTEQPKQQSFLNKVLRWSFHSRILYSFAIVFYWYCFVFYFYLLCCFNFILYSFVFYCLSFTMHFTFSLNFLTLHGANNELHSKQNSTSPQKNKHKHFISLDLPSPPRRSPFLSNNSPPPSKRSCPLHSHLFKHATATPASSSHHHTYHNFQPFHATDHHSHFKTQCPYSSLLGKRLSKLALLVHIMSPYIFFVQSFRIFLNLILKIIKIFF